ncbi:hypothetical protein VTI74DRAFT_6713 [Chaetomium olivicolor]
MDYNKSLYEVWKDTMEFMNRWNLFKEESQILPVGALVKSLLMANHGEPLSQILKVHEDRVDSTHINDPKSALVFRPEAIRLGCIFCVGPSASDIIASPSKSSKWRTIIQERFAANELVPARKENDRLLRALLASDDSEVEKMCFNRPSIVVWKQQKSNSPHTPSAHEYIQEVEIRTGFTTEFLCTPPQGTDQLASVQPRLYLVKRRCGSTRRKMGVASGLVRPGDLVCCVRSSRRALLVSVFEEGYGSTTLRVFGTALATDDMCGSMQDCDYAQRWMSLREGLGETMEVQLDAGTTFMLLE